MTKKQTISVALFLVILVLAFNLRRFTFNLPHFRGDQHHYVALAFKLDTRGMEGYNLREVDMYGVRTQPNVVVIAPAKDKGHILKGLAASGITYYDEPLHHMPFGFPLALMVSHKIFAPDEPYYMLSIPNDIEVIRQAPRGVGLRDFRFDPAVVGKQFYAIIVPLFFSLILIASVYFLAKVLYDDEWVALTAMFLITISPIDILTSQKVWADEMTVALTALAALLYMLAVKKEMPLLALVGGLACGLSAITKQNGAIVAFAIVLWHFIYNSDRLFRKETCLKVIFDKNLVLFGAGCLLSAGYWFYKVTATYGDPIYRPRQTGLLDASKTDWFKIVQSRPKRLIYLVGIPYQNPLFGLAYLSPLWLWVWKEKKHYREHLFAVVWLAVLFAVSFKFFAGEHRYMLPSYPAFAVLGAYVANRMRVFIDKQMGFNTGTVLLIAVLVFSAFWSVPMALEVLFHNGALIFKPF